MNTPPHDPLDTALRALAARRPDDARFTARVLAALPPAAHARPARGSAGILLAACTASTVSAILSLAGPDLARLLADGVATLAQTAPLVIPVTVATLAWGAAVGLRHWIASRN